jgi:Mce-associated membrane protein
VSAAQPPKPRRRIAGEAKPGEAPVTPSSAGPKFSKPKLPKRPKAEPVVASTVDLPAAPPRPDAVRVPRAKPSATVLTLLVLAIASLGFGAFGVWHGVDQWRSDNIAESRGAATDAAASASETIFSYRYNALDRHMHESQAMMTPQFAKKFRTISPALKALAPQRRIQVKAVVRYAAAKECGDKCSPRAATVLVFLDQARISSDTPKPTVFGNRIDVSMVNRNGTWLVDNIKAL